MKEYKDLLRWTLNHIWVIIASYIISMIVSMLVHGSFGFTMNEDGTYLSNALMSVTSGAVLALGTGKLQKELLKKHFKVSFFWVVALIIGFITAETIAGIVLWKMEIYRGLINVFNNDNHFPEALIYALAGLISGAIQYRILKPHYRRSFYWIVASTIGWGSFILSVYLGIFAIILGALSYGIITGYVIYYVLELKKPNVSEV